MTTDDRTMDESPDTGPEVHSPPAQRKPESSAAGMDEKLAAEIEEALGDMNLEDMLEMDHRPETSSTKRERRTGTIANIHGKDVFVEFGPKSQGVCPLMLFEEPPALGSQLEFIIDRYDEDDGLLILSLEGKVTKAEWESLEVGQIVEARCTGVNKGGLELEVASHRAFMPAGQVDLRHIPDLSVFIGEKFPCEVIEMNRQRARIILSRKSTMEAERAEQRVKLLASLDIGQQMPAVVTSIQPYGAFADIGGIDGLIHISDMSYERIKNPSEVVKEGDQINVKILKIDSSHDPPRIGLGMKQLMADPAVTVLEDINVGDKVSGRVTKLMPFGAFVALSPGVEGLIHISELSNERVNRVSSVVKPNEVITVKVLSVDRASRRISLSLKALKQDHEETRAREDDAQMRKQLSKLKSKFGELRGGLA